MSEAHQGTVFSFGRQARDLSNLPELTPDLCRSYQWPFHLRIHPDEWEFVGGKWRLVIERVGLRPGVGGVGGKTTDINSIEDLGLLSTWAKVGDRKWAILPSGDNRLTAIFPEGNFLRKVRVASGGREGTVIVAAWERVTEDGRIVTDEEAMTDIAAKVADEVFGLSGPSQRAVSKVVLKLGRLRGHLLASAGSSRIQGGSYQLKKRIERVSRTLYAITREESYLEGIELSEEPAQAPKAKRGKEKPEKVDQATATLAALAEKFGGVDKLAAALESLAAAKAGEVTNG